MHPLRLRPTRACNHHPRRRADRLMGLVQRESGGGDFRRTTMKARVAMFQHGTDRTWRTVFERPFGALDGDAWTVEPYVRISEWVDVEFPALASEVIVLSSG